MARWARRRTSSACGSSGWMRSAASQRTMAALNSPALNLAMPSPISAAAWALRRAADSAWCRASVDLDAQVLEDAGVGPVAGRLVGEGLRLLQRAVDDGAAGAFHRVADPFLPGPLARRLFVDRSLRALADLPRLVEAGLVELGLRRGADRAGPVAPLERGPGPLHHGGERHVVAGARDRLAEGADAGVSGAHLDGLGDERVGRLDVAAAERRLRVGEVLVGVLLVERRLGPCPQLARLRIVLVDGAGPVGEIDRLFEAAGVERFQRRFEVLRHLLGADAGEALRFGPGLAARLGGARRGVVVRPARRVVGLETRMLAGRRLVALEAAPHPRQVAVHALQVGVAPARILLERLVDDLLDFGVGVGDHLAQPRRRLLGDPSEHAVAEPARKGLLVAEQLIHHRADREDVGAVVDRQAAHLLGGHVVEAADQGAGVGDAGVGQLGDAEVEDLQAAAALLDHQVGRLDVAVDDVEGVGVGQPVAQLLEQPQLAGDGGRLLAADPHATASRRRCTPWR